MQTYRNCIKQFLFILFLSCLGFFTLPYSAFAQLTTHTTFTELAPKPTALSNVASTNHKGIIYTAGGWWIEENNAFEAYNIHTNKWTILPKMNRSRYDVAISGIDNFIYVMGGRSYGKNSQVFTDNEAFNIQTNKWEPRTPLPVPKEDAGSVVYNGKLFVIGGYQNGKLSNRVDIYHPDTNTWSTGTPLPKPKASFAIALYQDQIYIIGGRGGLRSVERYDLKKDTWEQLPDLNVGRFHHEAAIYKGFLYVISGQTKEGNFEEGLNSIEVYDVSLNRWVEVPDKLAIPRSRYGIAEASEGIILTAGWKPFALTSTVLYQPTLPPSVAVPFKENIQSVNRNKEWSITFSSQLKPEVSSHKVYILDSKGNTHPTTLSIEKNKIHLKPNQSYLVGHTYVLYLEDVVNIHNKHLEQKQYMQFSISH